MEEGEEPLRRSPRKQLPLPIPEAQLPLPSENKEQAAEEEAEAPEDADRVHVRRSSRNKHHKSKTKHHRVKRKKKKHSKGSENASLELNEQAAAPLRLNEKSKNDSVEIEDKTISKDNLNDSSDCQSDPGRIGDSELQVDLEKPKTEDVDRVELVEDVNRTVNDFGNVATEKNVFSNEVKDAETLDSLVENVNREASPLALSCDEKILAVDTSQKKVSLEIKEGARYLGEDEENTSVELENSNTPDGESKGDEASVDDVPQEPKVGKIPDDRKLRKKRKRIKYEANHDSGDLKNGSNNVADEHMHKHRKKKHKHTGEHKNKKHHDVRKAPQNGIVLDKSIEPTSGTTNLPPVIPESIGSIETNLENSLSEPQRFAIKIKLCQECNSRHLQDACPLLEPEYTISDSITYTAWLNEHMDNLEIRKTISCKDPMSEGYNKPPDDGFESDEDQPSIEQSKQRIKVESEEKQLTIDKDRPVYARDSLPECLELKVTSHDHGLGVYAKSQLPMYARLGPLVGIPVKEMDIPDDFSMRHIWEVR